MSVSAALVRYTSTCMLTRVGQGDQWSLIVAQSVSDRRNDSSNDGTEAANDD